MKTIYHTTNSDTLISIKPPRRLECIIIRNYPTKYAKVIKIFKDYLEGTPHITKYCDIKCDKYVNNTEFSKWHLNNVKPENIYVFPFYQHKDDDFLELFFSMKKTNSILKDYVCCPIFYKRSENPLEYNSSLGSLLVDECNLEYISE